MGQAEFGTDEAGAPQKDEKQGVETLRGRSDDQAASTELTCFEQGFKQRSRVAAGPVTLQRQPQFNQRPDFVPL